MFDRGSPVGENPVESEELEEFEEFDVEYEIWKEPVKRREEAEVLVIEITEPEEKPTKGGGEKVSDEGRY